MKILVVSNMYPDAEHPSYGIFVKRFCEQLDQLQIPYDLSVMYKSDRPAGKILGYALFYAGTVWKILRQKYSVVYVHYASHSSLPVLTARRLRHLCIWTNVHGSDVMPENPRQEKMQKYTERILKASRKIIVPSFYFRERVHQKYGLPMDRIFVYPSGGVDPLLFHPMEKREREEARARYGFSENTVVFGFAGRISEGKGWDTYLEAAAVCRREIPSAAFMLIGDGPQRRDMEEKIRETDLEGTLIRKDLLPQKELAACYGIMDFLVFPSRRQGESLGLVPLEAMACGTPVLSSASGAAADYIKEGINGFMHPPGDARALCACMKAAALLGKDEMENLRDGAILTAADYAPGKARSALKHIFEDETER